MAGLPAREELLPALADEPSVSADRRAYAGDLRALASPSIDSCDAWMARMA
jgi:hypothetical protein